MDNQTKGGGRGGQLDKRRRQRWTIRLKEVAEVDN